MLPWLCNMLIHFFLPIDFIEWTSGEILIFVLMCVQLGKTSRNLTRLLRL